MYYDDYDEDDDQPRRWKVIAGVVAAIALLGAVLVWQQRSGNSDDGAANASVPVAPIATDSDDLTTARSDTSSTLADRTDSGGNDATDTDSETSATASTTSSTVGESSTSVSATVTTSTTADRGVVPAATEPTAPSDTSATGDTEASFGYPTNPDGTPLPLVVVFDTDTITISGQVPSQAAKDRLGALAIANSQFPDAQLIDNMIINPAVPISVGVRVIELNSARFPEGSTDILPAHAAELDRVVNIMKALPNISVLIVGHADQRGDDAANFALSDQRARAVLNYLLYLGISPSRLASRAAGESDLLTTGEDDTSLALNRRTEFIFNGLLIE